MPNFLINSLTANVLLGCDHCPHMQQIRLRNAQQQRQTHMFHHNGESLQAFTMSQ